MILLKINLILLKKKIFVSLTRAYNQKGIFPFSLENPELIYSPKNSFLCRKILKQNYDFSSLKKEFNLNCINYSPDFIYGIHNNNLLESSENKDYFDFQNSIKKEINMSGQKRIRHKLDNEFKEILLSKRKAKQNEKHQNIIIDKNEIGKYPTIITINDKFFDILFGIYTNDMNEIEDKKENIKNNEKINEKDDEDHSKENIRNNIVDIKNNSSEKSNIKINEQISCICLKSKCINNYCRCHKNGPMCNENCRCIDCKNNCKYETIINSKNYNISTNKKKNYMSKCKTSD